MRVFAFAVPGALYAMYFLALALSGGVLWPTELWAGSILISAAVGLLISYLVLPSAVPVQGNPR
jgi:hypothetical protein